MRTRAKPACINMNRRSTLSAFLTTKRGVLIVRRVLDAHDAWRYELRSLTGEAPRPLRDEDDAHETIAAMARRRTVPQ